MLSLVKRVAAAALFCGAAFAARAEYPEHPVRLIVPFGAGSSTDLLARMVAKQMTDDSGQPIIVDDRPGAEGMIGMRDAAKAPADGYTVLFTSSSTQVLNPGLYNTLSYDPIKDFVAISTLAQFSLVMNVGPKAPFKSAQEMITAAKAAPGKYTFASGSAATRLGGELIQQMTGIKLQHVPYKSNAAALNDVMTGQVDMMFLDYPSSLPLYSLGVRPVATTGVQRISTLANVPTIGETAVKGYAVTGWWGVFLPANAPAPIAARLTAMIDKAMASPSAKEFMAHNGLAPYLVKGPDLVKLEADETAHWSQVIRTANIPKQ